MVAPETAVPLLPAQLAALAPDWWATHVEPIARNGRAVLVGFAPRGQASWNFGAASATARGLYRIVIPVARAAAGMER